MNNETIHSLVSSRNYTGNDAIDNVDNYVKEWLGMDDIYIILYSEHELADCYNTYSDGVYFTNKEKAINYLETNGYKHICDDEYKVDFNLHAEILKIELFRSDGE